MPSRTPVISLAGIGAPSCRLCTRLADLVERPNGHGGDEYAYCSWCVSAALERFDMDHPTVNQSLADSPAATGDPM